MSRASISRNALCPCGSGQKYKRCCLADEDRAVREARFDSAVGRRIQEWSQAEFHAELGPALEKYVGPDRVMDDDDIQIFATWFHNDRELVGGGTPAERYAARPDIPDDERAAASRIATARLGLFRVLSVEPGRSLRLEDVVHGARFEVTSPHVSREAVRWDILLGRAMDGAPPSLWGPTRTFEPCEEPALRGELERLSGTALEEVDERALAAIFRRHALELMRFRPASWDTGRSFFTLEGDPVVFATATWQMRDPAAAADRLRELGGLLPGEPIEVDLTASRASLVKQRRQLPLGAVVLESSPVGAMDTIPIASLRIDGAQLHVEAHSGERLDQAIEIVEDDLGDLVELLESNETSVDEALQARRMTRPRSLRASRTKLDPRERRLLGELSTERMLRWLDEPHQHLGGRTPREAAAGADRAEVVGLLRQLENGAERARRRGDPAADVTPLRRELGLRDELAA